MQAYKSAALERAVTDDCTDLSARAVRALTEKMTVLPDVGRVKDADDLFLVVSESGSEYLVDAREGICECADYQYREPGSGCKHILRVDYATNAKQIPAWADIDAVDPHLGEHTAALVSDTPATLSEQSTDSGPTTVQTDGGVAPEKATKDAVSGGYTDNAPQYTYHYEPSHVGGARYVRCEACGAECVPAKPDRMLHREGCSEGER